MDSNEYCGVLEDFVLNFAAVNIGKHFFFLKYNAAVQRSTYSLFCLAARNIEDMQWPSRSLHLNPT